MRLSIIMEGTVAHAQTNVQLFNQLLAAGYPDEELRRIARAYELATRLFGGLYRDCGKTAVAHHVGVASILASQPASGALVAAALLHAAYAQGDFGTDLEGTASVHRGRLRRAIGAPAENLVYRFTLRDAADRLTALHARRAELEPFERELALLRLANRLDNHLDGANLYGESGARRRKTIDREALLCAELARHLDFPALAAEYVRAASDVAGAQVASARRGDAQTNLQLFEQLRSLGYDRGDIDRVEAAYALAARLFAGGYAGSGKTMVAHCVGTASVLAADRAPAAVLVVALLHIAHLGRDGWTRHAGDRGALHSVLGEGAEEIASSLDRLRWDAETIPRLAERLPSFSAVERVAVLIRLAHVADQYSDGGIFYAAGSEPYRQWLRLVGARLVELARRLEAPFLAERLATITRETGIEPPPVLRCRSEDAFFVRPTRRSRM